MSLWYWGSTRVEGGTGPDAVNQFLLIGFLRMFPGVILREFSCIKPCFESLPPQTLLPEIAFFTVSNGFPFSQEPRSSFPAPALPGLKIASPITRILTIVLPAGKSIVLVDVDFEFPQVENSRHSGTHENRPLAQLWKRHQIKASRMRDQYLCDGWLKMARRVGDAETRLRKQRVSGSAPEQRQIGRTVIDT